MSTLLRKTTIAGTSTCRASRMCSRVCGIGPSGARHHQDRPVHLGRAGDHVLDEVGVPRAVDMGVVPLVGFVLHVRDGNGDAPLPLFRRVVDAVEAAEGRLPPQRQRLGDGRRQGRLAMVDVPDRPHVDMRFRALELLLTHLCFRPPWIDSIVRVCALTTKRLP